MITMVESEGSFGFDFGCFGCFSGWQLHQLVTLQQVIITGEIFEEFLFPSVCSFYPDEQRVLTSLII